MVATTPVIPYLLHAVYSNTAKPTAVVTSVDCSSCCAGEKEEFSFHNYVLCYFYFVFLLFFDVYFHYRYHMLWCIKITIVVLRNGFNGTRKRSLPTLRKAGNQALTS